MDEAKPKRKTRKRVVKPTKEETEQYAPVAEAPEAQTGVLSELTARTALKALAQFTNMKILTILQHDANSGEATEPHDHATCRKLRLEFIMNLMRKLRVAEPEDFQILMASVAMNSTLDAIREAMNSDNLRIAVLPLDEEPPATESPESSTDLDAALKFFDDNRELTFH